LSIQGDNHPKNTLIRVMNVRGIQCKNQRHPKVECNQPPSV